MGDIGIEFQKEFLVFWVVHGFLIIRTCEGFNGVPRLPQSQQRKLGLSLFHLPQHENTLVARDRGVLFQSGFLQVCVVGILVLLANYATPDASDHESAPCMITDGRWSDRGAVFLLKESAPVSRGARSSY